MENLKISEKKEEKKELQEISKKIKDIEEAIFVFNIENKNSNFSFAKKEINDKIKSLTQEM